jgi:hypothetical protein
MRTVRQPDSILSPSAKAAGWRSFCASSERKSKKTEPICRTADTANDAFPADQFEVFKKLAEERGLGAEDIAVRFGVTPHVVRQRLAVGGVSPKLMQASLMRAMSLSRFSKPSAS